MRKNWRQGEHLRRECFMCEGCWMLGLRHWQRRRRESEQLDEGVGRERDDSKVFV